MSVFTLFEDERQEQMALEQDSLTFFDPNLLRQARGNVELMIIYKKMENAAKIGDYEQLNELHLKFKGIMARSN